MPGSCGLSSGGSSSVGRALTAGLMRAARRPHQPPKPMRAGRAARRPPRCAALGHAVRRWGKQRSLLRR